MFMKIYWIKWNSLNNNNYKFLIIIEKRIINTTIFREIKEINKNNLNLLMIRL